MVRLLLRSMLVMSFHRAWHTLAQLHRVAAVLAVFVCAAWSTGCEHGGPHPEPPLANMEMAPPGQPGRGGTTAGAAGSSASGDATGGMPSSPGPTTQPPGQDPDPSHASDAGAEPCDSADAGVVDAGVSSDAGCDADAGD